MKKTAIFSDIIAVSFFAIYFFTPSIFAQSSQDALSAAQKEFKNWQGKIPQGHEKDYGFTDQNEIQQAVFEKPFQIFFLKDNFEDIDKHFTLEMIQPTLRWVIPIYNTSDIACLSELLYDPKNKSWEGVAFGQRFKAQGWHNVLTKWPRSQGYEHIYVEVFPKYDFIVLKKEKDIKIVRWHNIEEIFSPEEFLMKLVGERNGHLGGLKTSDQSN